ncbi:unnamed protein product, partial [Rotaria sordida]
MIAPLKMGEIRDATLLGNRVEAEKNPVGKSREGLQPPDQPKFVLF